MPYISQNDRIKLNNLVESLKCAVSDRHISTPGQLNYIFTVLAKAYVAEKSLTYTTLNDVVGVFESAKAEFQRRVVNPYEDAKIKEHGDV